ncbi:MAG TPA: HD domain-containing protein [Candidatus Eisenbacteria bacterium]|nr:HD domain-containing protein [Candidatus Eisenbacteria bacterium]
MTKDRFPIANPAEDAVASRIPAPALEVAKGLAAHGYRTVFVGGGVRDALLGIEPGGAWDLGTAATPQQVMKVYPASVPTGIEHGTVTLPIDGGAVEITTFRTEGTYTDARHPDHVSFTDDLSADLLRRDFTVNAMAYDAAAHRLVDEVGGMADLRAGILRAVGDPKARLAEDALRAMRAARLVSTRGFEIEPATRAALPAVAKLLPMVSAERVRDELTRLILGEAPDRGLDTLREAGLLRVVLPELADCEGVPQNRYHAFDVYRHTLETLRHAEPRFRVRWASLCHDLGKPATRGEKDNGEGTFYGHPQVGADITETLLERLRFPRAEREAIVLLVREHLFDYRPEWTDAAVRRFLKRVGWEHLDDLFDLRRADIAGTGVGSDGSSIDDLKRRIAAVRASRAPLSVGELAVDGQDVMRELGVGPGPVVGQILRTLLEEVLEDPARNDRAWLLRRLRSLA